jgi:hypothetical protein
MEEKLKENICREIANIPAEQLQRVNLNLFSQCKECLGGCRRTAFSTPPVTCEL